MNKVPNQPWWSSMGFSKPEPAREEDFADMGTAFGLDAITTIQPESPAEIAARQSAGPPSRIALRLHRRSTF